MNRKSSWIKVPFLVLALAAGVFAEPEGTGKDVCKRDFDTYKDRLAKNPDDDQAWTEFRVCVSELKRWHDGEEVAVAAIQQRPQRYEPHLILGIALLHGKEYQKAADEFQTATQLKADAPQSYYYLGMADLFLNHPADAAQAADKAVQLDPKNATYYSQVAYAQFLIEDNDKCEVAAKKAIELDPNNVAAYKVLGNLYEREGRQADSDKAFEEAMHANGRTAASSSIAPHPSGAIMDPSAAAALPGMSPLAASPSSASSGRMAPVATAPAVAEAAPAPESEDANELCKTQWSNMKEAVGKGDLDKTLTYFSDYLDTRDQYRQSFQKLGITRVQGMLAALGDVEECSVSIATANCKAPIAIRPGTTATATIRFERNTDGVWRIRSF